MRAALPSAGSGAENSFLRYADWLPDHLDEAEPTFDVFVSRVRSPAPLEQIRAETPHNPASTEEVGLTVGSVSAVSLLDATPKRYPIAISDHRMPVAFFNNERGTKLTSEEVTLGELAERISLTEAPTKQQLPLLRGSRFGDDRSPKTRSLRHNANVLSFSMIHLDYDKEEMSFQDAVARLKAAGIRGLVHSSPSYTTDRPRLRLLLPTSRERPPSEYASLARAAAAKLDIEVGPESYTLSQPFYYGTARKVEISKGVWVDGTPIRTEIIDGDFADIVLADACSSPAEVGSPQRERGRPLKNTAPADRAEVERALEVIASDDYQVWLRIGAALHDEFGDEGFDLFDRWSAKSDKYDDREVERKWEDCKELTQCTIGTVFHYANETCPDWKRREGASQPRWREQFKTGEPKPTLHNARVALNALGIECKQDVFQSRLFIGHIGEVSHEVQQLAGELSDDGIIALRRIASDAFGANFGSEVMLDAVRSIAIDHQYDPVCDMLDEAEAAWDGEPRLDRMAVDYLNAEDTLVNRAFIRKTMIAAVRRARHPGCKFDNITVLESPEGWNKSGFWRVLAGDPFYSDESIIGRQSREIQEQLSTVWIHENAELAGMKKQEVETVKAYASRQEDIARPAYGRVVKRQPRHSIDVGTTNADTYLQSQTGNRRFWPIKVLAPIDLDKLKRDRIQLLGEAAAYEKRGETITLDPSLWSAAGVEQDARRIRDPWEDILDDMPTHAYIDQSGHAEHIRVRPGEQEPVGAVRIIHVVGDRQCVATATLLQHVLQVPRERQTQTITMRLSTTMKQVGWERHHDKLVIDGQRVRGYWRSLPQPEE